MKLIKQQNGVAALEIILILIIIGIIGFTGYYVMHKNRAKPISTSSSSSNIVKAPVNLQELVDRVTQIIPKQYSFAKVADPGNKSEAGVSYRIEGYDFVVEAANEKTAALFKTDTVTGSDKEFQQFLPVGDAIGKELVNAGMKLNNDSSQTPYNDPINRTQYYTDSESICMVHVNTGTARLDCVPRNNFSKTAATAKPLVEAYLKKDSAINPKNIIISTPDIKSSKTADYRFAQMSIGEVNGGGSSALFYEKNGMWVYFKSSQMMLPCSDYQSNPDIKKAFLGETCEDPSTNAPSTVQ